jgi:hypothetical protein
MEMTVDDKRNYTLEQQLAHKTTSTRAYNERHGNGGFFDKPVALSVSEAEELQAELARLTAERDAAIEDAREMTTRFDLLNNIACEVVDSYFGVTVDSEAQMFQMMKALREATVDDGRPAAPTPPIADTGAGDAETVDLSKAFIESAQRSLSSAMDYLRDGHQTLAFEMLAVSMERTLKAISAQNEGGK